MLLPLARIVTVVCAILSSGVLPYAQTLPLPQQVWVKTAELFAAMNTTDSDNENKTRGYVLVAKK